MERAAQKVTIRGAAVMLPPGRTIDVVVESEREAELVALVGKRREAVVEVPVVAVLIREVKSLDERHATQVLVNPYLVGRLSRADAAAYGPLLDALLAEGLLGACEGRIIAGWPHQGNYSVKLWLALPEVVQAYLDKGAYRATAFDPAQTPPPDIPWSLPDRSRRTKRLGCLPMLCAGVVVLGMVAGLLLLV
jgi:hypothetical protein